MKRILIITALSIIFGFMVGYSIHHWIHPVIMGEHLEETNEVLVIHEHPYYLMEEVNEEVLYKTLVHYDFPEPAIITAQAVLESGHFKSKLFLEKNNMFGLYNSRKLEFYTFDSWLSCVFAYRDYILYKRKDNEDYYSFLNRIGYASDPDYIEKVKNLEIKIKGIYGSGSEN